MSVITRATHPSALWPGVKAFFGKKYRQLPPEWSQIFEEDSSDKGWEDFVETGGFGLAPVKTEAAPIQYDSDAEGYKSRLQHVVYGLGYIVTREEQEDNQYVEVSKRRSAALARSMRVTAEIVHANILNRGFSTGYPIGDAAAMLSLAHPTPSGNQANILSAAADLSEASLEDMLTLISQMKDRRGLPIAARGLKLVVHPSNEFNAYRLLESALRTGTPNNDINAIKAMGLLSGGVVVNHYLTDADAWFITTDVPEGLKSLWRRKVELEDGNDFDTENLKAKATMRFVPGIADWRAIVGSPGA